MNLLPHCRPAAGALAIVAWLAVTLVVTAEINIIDVDQRVRGEAPVRVTVPPPAGAGATEVADADTETSDLLRFKNGDVLHGSLVGMPSPDKILWQHPDTEPEITFAARHVVQVRLAGHGVPPPPGPLATVQLTNDDELQGKVTALDAERLVLETWYAGPLTIKRTMVTSIGLETMLADTIYAGPTGMEGWQHARQRSAAWRYSKGAFYSTTQGGIGRDVGLPDRARVEFDLAWRNFPQFMLALYTGDFDQILSDGYILQWSGNTVYLQRARNRDVNNLGGAINLDDMQRRTKFHVTVLVDKPKKSVSLLIDGALTKQWVDPGDFAGTGTGLMLQSQGQGALRFSNLRVSTWDGQLDQPATAATPRSEDVIRLVNNDKVSGRLESIANDKITFVTSYATLDIPLDRASIIQLAADKAERARRQAADIRAVFRRGGRVTLAVETLDGQSLSGTSENFGRQSFTRQAFRELQLNIYDETAAETTDEWEF
ncbi:hypothetical protein HQ590_01180 [bacterium]|nr:hypothetical protein [bacterium]